MVDVGDFGFLRCLGVWEFCFCFWILIDFGIEGCMGFWYLFVVFLFSFLNCGIVGLWDCVFFLFWILELLDFGCVGVWWNSLDV